MVEKHVHIHIIIGGYKGEVRGCSSCNHHQSLSNIVYTSITTCVISKRILSLVNHFILTSFHLVYVMSYRISAYHKFLIYAD